MNDIRTASASLRSVGDAVHEEWDDAASARFRRDVVAPLVAASLALARAQDAARDEITRARQEL